MSANEAFKKQIDVSTLPDISLAETDFLDSSFFQSGGSPSPQLPTPASILQEYGDQGACVIQIDHLSMAVKINHEPYLRLEEAQTMWAVRRLFPDGEVPVPEVFGWRKYDGRVFIYMSLIPGKTLREAWPSLTIDDKNLLQVKLKEIVASLKKIQSPEIIGSVNGGPVQDRFFRIDSDKGPYSTIKEFNDWLFAIATHQKPGPDEAIQGLDHPDMYRGSLPDTGEIFFTHADITLGNIMVSGSPGSYAITGIIDWEQAGWYPEYWEYCKILYGVELDHEWRTEDWGARLRNGLRMRGLLSPSILFGAVLERAFAAESLSYQSMDAANPGSNSPNW